MTNCVSKDGIFSLKSNGSGRVSPAMMPSWRSAKSNPPAFSTMSKACVKLLVFAIALSAGMMGRSSRWGGTLVEQVLGIEDDPVE